MKQNSPKLHIIYRLSDKGENKNRMSKVNNKTCLFNFLKEFPVEDITMIADNVEEVTNKWLEPIGFNKIYRTQLGNAGSFWYAYQLALSLPSQDYIYFVENDYIHKPLSRRVLFEGLKIADYVSLYDHPDKYKDGINPQVKNGGEKTKVFLSESTHWKKTNSTTMTFASKVNLLKKDKFIFKLFTKGIIKNGSPILKKFQERKIPSDYQIFTLLNRLKKRVLISPVPGYSTHIEVEFLAPLTNWDKILNS